LVTLCWIAVANTADGISLNFTEHRQLVRIVATVLHGLFCTNTIYSVYCYLNLEQWEWYTIFSKCLINIFYPVRRASGNKINKRAARGPGVGPHWSRQSAHKWRWVCLPYAAATLCRLGRFLVLRLSRRQGRSAVESIRSIETNRMTSSGI
jgi:hypothetical protein